MREGKTILDSIFINTFYFILRIKNERKGEVMYLKYLTQNF